MLYRIGRLELVNGTAGNLASAGKFKCALVGLNSSYLDEHPDVVGDFTLLDELTAGTDKTITSVTLVRDDARDAIFIKADNPAWTGLTPDEIVAGLVIYRFVTNMGLSIPYYGIPLGQPKTIPGSGEYTFPFNDDGIAQI